MHCCPPGGKVKDALDTSIACLLARPKSAKSAQGCAQDCLNAEIIWLVSSEIIYKQMHFCKSKKLATDRKRESSPNFIQSNLHGAGQICFPSSHINYSQNNTSGHSAIFFFEKPNKVAAKGRPQIFFSNLEFYPLFVGLN